MLVTYGDTLGGDLPALGRVLAQVGEAAGGVHLLSCYPSDLPRGEGVQRYDKIDPALGTWADVTALSRGAPLMLDMDLTQVGAHFIWLQEALRDPASPWRGIYHRWADCWPGGAPTPKQLELLQVPRPDAPAETLLRRDGRREQVWSTFGLPRVDVNLQSPAGERYCRTVLGELARRGAAFIRLKHVEFAVKQPGSSCRNVEPDTGALLARLAGWAAESGAAVVTDRRPRIPAGCRGCDNALPALLCCGFARGDAAPLCRWLAELPRDGFTTLDGPEGMRPGDSAGWLTPGEQDAAAEWLWAQGGAKKLYTTAAYGGTGEAVWHTTWASAMRGRPDRCLLGRAVQLFAPGTPLIYYMGLLWGENDVRRAEATLDGGEIQRHGYTEAEIAAALRRPPVQQTLRLLRFRNLHPAFHPEGTCRPDMPSPGVLRVTRQHGVHRAVLTADLRSGLYSIVHSR